jgi:predicted nucleic acid-binding Zn ribbon protein
MPYVLKYVIQHRCLQCGKDLPLNGRPDRKFCSVDCKNQFHNRQRRYPPREELEWAVYQALKTNHTILDRLQKMGVRTIDLATLSQLGYDARFVTSYIRLGRRNIFTLFDLKFEMTPTQIKRLSCLRLLDGEII